jgi:transposase
VNLEDIAVAMKSTGCYHINHFSFLCAEGLRCAVVNPPLLSKFVQGSLRKIKTDKKDSMTIGAVSSEQREEALRGNVITRYTGSEGSGRRTTVSVMDDRIT